MSLYKITNRIYCLEKDDTTDRPVLGYIRGDNYSLAIDAGNSQKHVEKFYEAIKDKGFEKPDYTAITHWHWDHTFGMHAVSGKTIVSYKTSEKLKEVAMWSWSEEAMVQRIKTGVDIKFCDEYIKLEYPDRKQIKVVSGDIIFENHLTLDLGGVHCMLMQVIAPHSEDSVIVYIPEEKTVFIGDADCGDFYNNDGLYDKEKLASFLETISSLEFANYIIGHDQYETKDNALKYLEEEYNKL